MGLETGTYISDLVPSNPLGTDDRSQGDDHIRLIKQVLKNTFPNVNGVVTTSEEQLNVAAADGSFCFPGMIVMWSGTVASIPAGWKLCNGVGTISTGGVVPNLADRFIIGSATTAGGTYNIGQTGGSANIPIVGTTAGHALTVAQMPSHNHTINNIRSNQGGTGPSFEDATESPIPTSNVTDNAGGGQAHSHGINITLTGANIPPYFALAFLIKN